MTTPDIPVDDPALTVLGKPTDVTSQVTSLWRRWRSTVEDGIERPCEQTSGIYDLGNRMSSRRKGRDQVLARARKLLIDWEESALHQAAASEAGERVLVARVPQGAVPRRGAQKTDLDRLTEWELGALVSYSIATDWVEPSLVVRVPEPVADRLLSGRSLLDYGEQSTVPSQSAVEPERLSDLEYGLGPGVFDDTPVHARRLLTLEHVRALRETLHDPEQMYIVFSRESGLEVVPLSVLEERCGSGWQGVIVAGASDLPDVLFRPSSPPRWTRARRKRTVGGLPTVTTRNSLTSGRTWALRRGRSHPKRLCGSPGLRVGSAVAGACPRRSRSTRSGSDGLRRPWLPPHRIPESRVGRPAHYRNTPPRPLQTRLEGRLGRFGATPRRPGESTGLHLGCGWSLSRTGPRLSLHPPPT